MKEQVKNMNSSPSCIYVMGLVGSSVYFITVATGFWSGVLGFLKALVWPAFLVYELFTNLSV